MDSRPRRTAAAERVYEDFEPEMDWLREPGADTLRVYVPGFRKDQMKVQATSNGILRISGERPLLDGNKWCRFRKEIPISSTYDLNAIGAKFEKGLLFIRHPKIPETQPQEIIKPSMESPKPQPKEAPKPPADPPKFKKQPSDVSKPRKSTEPAETSKPATKIEPSKPEKPVTTETSKPATKIESSKPEKPAAAETSKPSKKIESSKPEKPVAEETSKPVTKTEPSKLEKPVPGETPKSATKIEPSNSEKPVSAETPKPAPKVQPSKPEKPVAAELSKPAKKIEPSKPENPASEPQAPNIGMDGQNSGKADGEGKMIEKKKVTSKYEQKDKSNGVADTGRDMTTTNTNTNIKQEQLADSVQDKTDKNGVGKGIIRENYGKFAAENFKQVFGDMVMEIKKPRNLNWVLAVVVLVLGFSAIRYLKKSDNK